MINRPRWVVPVLPNGELEILLDASINLSKQGIDHRSEACQRFYRDGLTISFTKILTDEAVSGWKFEIHRCIMKNCEHLIDLCVLKLNQDCLPLLELLAMVLNPNSKFHSFNGTRPSETVPTGSQIPDEEIFARPSDLRTPRLITYGENRNATINTMINALDAYVIRGLTHNIPLLRDIMTEPNFVSGNISTKYLNQVYPEGFKGKQLTELETEHLASLCGCIFVRHEVRSRHFLNQPQPPLESTVPAEWNLISEINGKKVELLVCEKKHQFEVSVNGRTILITGDLKISNPVLEMQIENERYTFQLIKHDGAGNLRIRFCGTTFNVRVLTEIAAEFERIMLKKTEKDSSKIVCAPMPGLLKSIVCKAGDEVAEGQEVCVIEAMKMQNSLSVSTTGKVKNVFCKEGDAVEEDQIIVELE